MNREIVQTFSPLQVYLDFMLGSWIGEDGSQSQDMSGFFKLFAALSTTVIVFTYSANILGQWIGEIQSEIDNLKVSSRALFEQVAVQTNTKYNKPGRGTPMTRSCLSATI